MSENAPERFWLYAYVDYEASLEDFDTKENAVCRMIELQQGSTSNPARHHFVIVRGSREL